MFMGICSDSHIVEMRKKRLLFAAVDIGFRVELYSKFIKEKFDDRMQVESFTKFKLDESHYKTDYTYVCPVDKHGKLYVYVYCLVFFIYSLFRYDVFHFFSGETILTYKLRRFEFRVYKLFGKRIIMHFVGSDVRNPQFLFWKNTNLMSFLNGERDFPRTLKWQDELIKDSLEFADEILVSTPDLLAIIPSATYFPVLIDLEKFDREVSGFNSLQNENSTCEPYKILHSPSNARVKGTLFIHQVLKNLKAEYKNDLETIIPGDESLDSKKFYSVSRYDLFSLLKESDVMIDQLVIGWYGLQSLEALLCGNVVLCYIEDGLEKYLYPECPILNVNAIDLQENLADLLKKRKRLSKYEMKENLEWVKKYHTIENNHKVLVTAWAMN